MGFHEGNVSDRHQGEGVHTTHVLDGISCKQNISNRNQAELHTTHTLDGFHPGDVSDRN